MRRLARRFALRQGDNIIDDRRRQRRLAGRPRLIAQQPIDALLHEALLHEALLPMPKGRLGDVRRGDDGVGAEVGHRQKHDAATPDIVLRAPTLADNRLYAGFVGGGHGRLIRVRIPQTRTSPSEGNPIRNFTE